MQRVTVFEDEWKWLRLLAVEPCSVALLVVLDADQRGAVLALIEQGLLEIDSACLFPSSRGRNLLRVSPSPGPNGARVWHQSGPEDWWWERSGFLPQGNFTAGPQL